MQGKFLVVLAAVLALCSSSLAGVASGAAREAAEYLLERFGKEVGGETLETLSVKIGNYGARYGDDAIQAIRKTGPRTFRLIDDAGENAPEVIRLINHHGNDAVWVASQPRRLAIFVKYGDDAAEAMIKHPGVSAPAIEKYGISAAKALQNVSDQNARRITMMVNDGSLSASNKAAQLLEAIGKQGDRAANWVWENKGFLAVAAVATAFVNDPEPFLNGTVEIVKVGGEIIVRPVVTEVAKSLNWNLIALSGAVIIVLSLVYRIGWQRLISRRAKFRNSAHKEPPKESTRKAS